MTDEDVIETEGLESEGDINESTEEDNEAFEAAEKKRAGTMGWKPLSEFRGDKAIWKDYPEFLEFGENRIAVMGDNMATMQRKINDMERRETLQQSTHETAMKAMRLRAEKEYSDRVQEAIEEGDKGIEARAAVQRDAELAVYQEPEPQTNPYDEPLADFSARNTWYGENQVASDFADAEGARVRNRSPGLSPDAELMEVENAVRKEFPKLFSNPNRQKASAVGSGRRPARASGAKSYGALSTADQQACDEAVEYGFVKNRKAFVENHFLLKEQSSE